MEQVIKALKAMPDVSWALYSHAISSGVLYSGSLSQYNGAFVGESTSRSYHTKQQADPHDVMVDLLGIAMKWQEQAEKKEADDNGKV